MIYRGINFDSALKTRYRSHEGTRVRLVQRFLTESTALIAHAQSAEPFPWLQNISSSQDNLSWSFAQ